MSAYSILNTTKDILVVSALASQCRSGSTILSTPSSSPWYTASYCVVIVSKFRLLLLLLLQLALAVTAAAAADDDGVTTPTAATSTTCYDGDNDHFLLPLSL